MLEAHAFQRWITRVIMYDKEMQSLLARQHEITAPFSLKEPFLLFTNLDENAKWWAVVDEVLTQHMDKRPLIGKTGRCLDELQG